MLTSKMVVTSFAGSVGHTHFKKVCTSDPECAPLSFWLRLRFWILIYFFASLWGCGSRCSSLGLSFFWWPDLRLYSCYRPRCNCLNLRVKSCLLRYWMKYNVTGLLLLCPLRLRYFTSGGKLAGRGLVADYFRWFSVWRGCFVFHRRGWRERSVYWCYLWVGLLRQYCQLRWLSLREL